MSTNQVADISIFSVYAIKHIAYIVVMGCLSYNIPQIFKIKAESGYTLRAGLMSAASLAMLPIFWVLPESYISFLDLAAWGLCFSSGLFFSAYGSSKLQAKFSAFLSNFTIRNSIRKGAKTDIRQMKNILPIIANYNPIKYIKLNKGIFIGHDENIKPIYLKEPDDWYKRHFLIVGSTRTGKGIIMGYLGVQSLRLGETVIFLDPKGDKFMPHIYKAECEQLGVPYDYIDLTQDSKQINLIADFNGRDLKNCFIEAFSQREMGSESDVYRKNEQEFLENFANFIVASHSSYDRDNASVLDRKSLVDICKDYDVQRYSDKFKSSVSDLNKLCNIGSINAASGKSLSELFDGGGCIYIVGDLLDETMKKIQRFIFCRFVQLARNHANEVDLNGGEEKQITIFADEFVAHVSRFVAESFTVSLGWGLKIVSAIQDLKLLKGAPADIDPEFLEGAVFGNSQNKLFYRADDIATADFLSEMTGKIQIEEEQKVVTRNSLNSEQLDRQTRLTQSERNYFDRNMILNLKQFEAIFCASLGYRDTIACLCKTSPVPVPKATNGKQIISILESLSADNVQHSANNNTPIHNNVAPDSSNQSNVSNGLKTVDSNSTKNNNTTTEDQNNNLDGDNNASSQQQSSKFRTTNSTRAKEASSAKKSDHLF